MCTLCTRCVAIVRIYSAFLVVTDKPLVAHDVPAPRPIAGVDIPAGGTLELKPGGYHIMLINLKQELKVGDKIELTLTFEKAAPIVVTAEVRES